MTAIGGYVGSVEEWRNVEELWSQNKKLWNLPEFSIAKIMSGRTNFGSSMASECIRSFGRIIYDSKLEGVSAAINDADWECTYKSDRFPNKYHSCVSMLFHILDQHVILQFPNDPVSVVCDTDHAPDAALAALCKEWKQESSVISSITFGRRTEFPALECADLCAGNARLIQLQGDAFDAKTAERWTTSYAKRHRSTFWSLDTAKQIEQMLREREERLHKRSTD